MAPTTLEAYVDAAAAALALPLDAAHRPGVLRYVALAAGMADQVAAVPLDPALDDPAPVFVPVAPDDLVVDADDAGGVQLARPAGAARPSER